MAQSPADATFAELKAHWSAAYGELARRLLGAPPKRREAVISAWSEWMWAGLEGGGAELGRRLFDRRLLPEQYSGAWTDDHETLQLANKIVLVMINPGAGIPFEAYFEGGTNRTTRSLIDLLLEHYVDGRVLHEDREIRFLFTRALLNAEHAGVHNRRAYSWRWWSTHTPNILRSLGRAETADEEEAFVTLELFAYQSRTAGELTFERAQRFRSTRLVLELVENLRVLPPDRAPTAIVLINRGEIWRRALENANFERVCDHPGHARFQRAAGEGVPVLLVEGAQQMLLPRRAHGGECLFPAHPSASSEEEPPPLPRMIRPLAPSGAAAVDRFAVLESFSRAMAEAFLQPTPGRATERCFESPFAGSRWSVNFDRSGRLRVELYIHNNPDLFDRLHRSRALIERGVHASVSWQARLGKHRAVCRIAVYLPETDPGDATTRSTWARDRLLELVRALGDRRGLA